MSGTGAERHATVRTCFGRQVFWSDFLLQLKWRPNGDSFCWIPDLCQVLATFVDVDPLLPWPPTVLTGCPEALPAEACLQTTHCFLKKCIQCFQNLFKWITPLKWRLFRENVKREVWCLYCCDASDQKDFIADLLIQQLWVTVKTQHLLLFHFRCSEK